MASGERSIEHIHGRGALRGLGRLLLESVVAGAFVSLVLALAVFIVATQAQAAPPTTSARPPDVLQAGLDFAAGRDDAVPDADRITPLVADPAQGAINPVGLSIGLAYEAIGGVPQTATPARFEMIVGLLLLATSLLGYAALRRRTGAAALEPAALRRLSAAAYATRCTC